MKSQICRAVAALEPLESRRLLADVTAFLSDLPQINPANGWGPIERDRSNGEIGATDGRTITLNGQTYAKGVGVHAASEVSFDVQAVSGFTSFLADIGVDDEVGSNGSVIFQVWLDTQIVFDSGVMTGSTATRQVTVNIAGVTARVRLVVTDGGNGKDFDHADWANARFFGSTLTPSVSLTRTSGGPIPEGGGSAGFLFMRQGSTIGPLTVNFGAGGTATRGSDYTLHLGDANGPLLTGNSVTIANGATSALVTVVATQDSILDPNENVIIGIAGGAGYTIGGPNTASVDITDDDQAVGFAYLSDLPMNTAINGWGPVQLDRSNGETGPADGRPITLNGVRHAKGLGVHAYSEITYNLSGVYNTFNAIVGVDDEVGNNGSVRFQVYSNNIQIFDSGVLTGAQPGLPVSLDITGTAQLKLVVTDGGNGNGFDHADWADARVGLAGSLQPPVLSITNNNNFFMLNWTQSPGEGVRYGLERKLGQYGNWREVFQGPELNYNESSTFAGNTTYYYRARALNASLSSANSNQVSATTTFETRPGPGSNLSIAELGFVMNANGWGPVERDRSNGETGPADGHEIFGLGVHANSDIVYNLDGHWNRFTSRVRVDEEVGNSGSVVFQVFLDGLKVFDSGTMTGVSADQMIDLNATGKTQLRLVVTDAGDGPNFDHADWLSPLVYLPN